MCLRFGLLEDRPGVETYEEMVPLLGVSRSEVASNRCDGGLSRLRQVLVLQTENHQSCCEMVQADYYTVSQAASLLGVDGETVRRYIRAGRLPATWEVVPFIGEIFTLPKQPVHALLAERQRAQMVDAEMDDYYTVSQAASLLGMAKASVSRYASTGRLPAKKVMGRLGEQWIFPKQAVHAFLADRQSSSSVA